MMAALAEIEAGWYDLSCVVGIEQMKTVPASEGGDFLGTAAWYEQEAKGVEFPFPKLFGKLGDEYDKRFGLKDEHLAGISAINYANAKLNPLAQTRTWYMNMAHACASDEYNSAVGGRIRIADCSQVTDGAEVAERSSSRHSATPRPTMKASRECRSRRSLASSGGGTTRRASGSPTRWPRARTARSCFAARAQHDHRRVESARRHQADVSGVDGIETHDCFDDERGTWPSTTSASPGPVRSWKAVEARLARDPRQAPDQPQRRPHRRGSPGRVPPGVRQVLDCYKQVTGTAGDYQVEGAKTFQTLNIPGGSGDDQRQPGSSSPVPELEGSATRASSRSLAHLGLTVAAAPTHFAVSTVGPRRR